MISVDITSRIDLLEYAKPLFNPKEEGLKVLGKPNEAYTSESMSGHVNFPLKPTGLKVTIAMPAAILFLQQVAIQC